MTLLVTLLVQGTIAGSVALVAARILRHHSPSLRLGILLLGAASFVIPIPSPAAGAVALNARTLFVATPLLLLAALVYLAGVMYSFLRLAMESMALRRLVSRTVAGPAQLEGPVRVLVSNEIAVPFAADVNGPLMVLPTSVLGEPGERLDAILQHELAHLRNHDLRTYKLLAAFRALLWFHPVAWALVRAARAAMEERCDDAVLRHASPLVYATALVDLAARNSHGARPAAALGMATAEVEALAARIERMGAPEKRRSRIVIPALVAIALITGAAAAAPRIAVQHIHIHHHAH